MNRLSLDFSPTLIGCALEAVLAQDSPGDKGRQRLVTAIPLADPTRQNSGELELLCAEPAAQSRTTK